jgi:hypothetical protein
MTEGEFMYQNDLFCIPHSFLVVVDDVGWWCGDDHRYKNGPSRSGIGRRHHIEDYKVIIELGRSLNMRIKCGFVAGEWDRSNLLARVRNSNKYGALWDNASRLDPQIDEARDIINSESDYMELALHGVMHMYWTDEGNMEYAEFYQTDKESGRNKMTPPDIVREHLDAFFEIMRQNGLTTDIKSFIPPCFRYVYSPGDDHLSSILAEYGIRYVSTPYASMEYTTEEKPVGACVENGIINVDRTTDLISWYAVDANPPDVVKKSYFGMHWPNFLNKDPEKNSETVKKWIKYFKQYKNNFEILPARDNTMGSVQALYKRFTDAAYYDGRITLNFSEVDKQDAKDLDGILYINIKKPFKPIPDESIETALYEEHDSYNTYKITRRKPFAPAAVINITE